MKISALCADIRDSRQGLFPKKLSRTVFHFRWLGGFFVCLMLFTLIPFITASDASGARKLVRVGYCPSYGVISTSREGSYTGYGYEYLLEVSKYTGWKYEFVAGTWEECLERLKNGSIDLLGPMQYTKERGEDFIFPSREFGYEYGVLYTRADDKVLHYDDFASFNGMKVGIVPGNFYNKPFEEYRQKNVFRVTYVSFAEPQEMMYALESGVIDSAVCAGLFSARDVKLVARFAVEPFYMAASAGNNELILQLNKALESIRTNNLYYDAQLYAKYFRTKEISQPAFTREEERFARSGPVLKMGVLTNWIPMEFMDKAGEFHGISADLIRLLAARCGLRLQFVPVRSTSEAMEGIREGTIDLVCGYGELRGKGLPIGMQFTTPYLHVPMVFVGSNKTHQNTDWRIAIPKGFSSLRSYVIEHYKDATIISLESFSACMQAVRDGKADLALSTSYFYDKMGGSPEFEKLRIVSITNVSLSMSIGVSGNLPPVVLSTLEKALTRISERERNEIVFANTLPVRQPLTLKLALQEYGILVWGMISLFVVAGLLLYIYLRRQTDQRLRRMAYIDSLTGHPNWNRFTQEAESLLARGEKTCAVLDIDNFKLINDYFGYETGSRALCHVADTITNFLLPGEIAARQSGDIFVLLLTGRNEKILLQRIAALQERIMTFTVNIDGEGQILYTACGICIALDGDTDLNKLYDRANAARKSVKPVHENARAFYDTAMRKRVVEELEIEKHMEHALIAGEFRIYLQPKFDLKTEHMVGAEALVRWEHPMQGLIPPDIFVPLFEKNGFILKLDMFMLEQVCKRIRQWMDNGMKPLPIAVNISKVHIHTSDFVRNVQDIVSRYQIPPQLIELELTETAFFDNTSALLAAMQQLSESGFTLSMDDFGSGYSSLNMLKNIPVQVLKLDRAFFDPGEAETRGRLVVSCIVQMAKALQMKVVSEGVETREQADFLRSIGCDFAQGFYYARPTPIDEFERLRFPEK